MKTKISLFNYEAVLARATARSYGIKRSKRKYNTYTKDEVTMLARNLKTKR